jgi:hypothetical protein
MNRLQQSRRGLIGFVYKPQVNNKVSTVNYTRSPFAIQEASFDQRDMGLMSGDGFIDMIREVISKGKPLLDSQSKVSALFPDSDKTARPGFVGEKHALLKLPNGKTGVANYMGPGTNIMERLKRGDPPRTATDKAAQAHDIRYALSNDKGDIRRADNIMINKVKQISRNRGDALRNINQANLLRVKVAGENLGVLKRNAFSGNMPDSKKDKDFLTQKLKQVSGGSLQMPGGAMLPGDALKLKLLKQMARKRTKRISGAGFGKPRTGLSMSKTLPGTKNYVLMGQGCRGGGKGSIQKFVVKKVVPTLMASVGIPKETISQGSITSLITKALDKAKGGKLSQIIANLSKTILPLLTAAKLKHLAGGRVKMNGKGLGQVLGKHKNMLLSNLGKGLLSAFKWYLNNNAKRKGLKPMFGSGINLPGAGFGSFFKGFKKGFKTVFKPGAAILGAAATALGQPEIGVPLTIAGKLT